MYYVKSLIVEENVLCGRPLMACKDICCLQCSTFDYLIYVCISRIYLTDGRYNHFLPSIVFVFA